MNQSVNRGIQAVRADVTDPRAIIEGLHNAFAEFKEKHDGRVSNLESQLSAIETAVARGQSLPGGGGSVSPAVAEYTKVFNSWLKSGADAGLMDMAVRAGLRSDDDGNGGYLVPTELDNQIERLENDSVAMRKVALVKTVKSGDYKKLISAGGAVSGWVSETAARPETGNPTLKQINPVIGEIYANPAITQTLLDDSAFDAGEWLTEEISSSFADQEGAAFCTGNGVGKPTGILTYPTDVAADATRAWGTLQHVLSGSAATFVDPDKLIDIVHSLKAGYRQGACWMMNSKTIGVVRKFKDGEGNYLWRDSIAQGQPDSLLGYPVFEDENYPDIAAGALPIAFGNFKRGYIIVDRQGLRLLRDPLTARPWVLFYATRRVGGCCQNFQAIKLLKIGA